MTTNCSSHTNFWCPKKILNLEINDEKNYAVVVLNRDIIIDPNYMKSLWDKANIRITVDGGTNRWLKFLKSCCSGENIKSPDYITGDFDSVNKSTLDYFANSDCKKIHTPDQNETDFTKGLRVLESIKDDININYIIVIQECSGRLDHIMGNINTLFLANKFLAKVQIYLINSNSLTWLLTPGKHSIDIPNQLVEDKAWCCLIPMGNRCIVTTNGLKWNFTNHCTEFGGVVSTSNTYDNKHVQIDTSGFLLWSMGAFSLLDDL